MSQKTYKGSIDARISRDVSGAVVSRQTTGAWANNAAANTVKSLTQISSPAYPVQNYLINVVNPSTESDLTVKLFNTRTINSVSTKCYLTSLTVPKAATIKGTAIGAYDFMVQGLFVAGTLDVDISNDTLIGAAGTFAATVTIYEA